MPATSPATALPSKGELTRQDILEAAIVRFGREGYRATSVADIARDAEVGGTVPYAYFPGKEALFLAAVDEDAAGMIRSGLASAFAGAELPEWRETLLVTLVAALDQHPLARRLLGGLEPDVTRRVLDMPALEDLRHAVAERLAAEQHAGTIRGDVDATTMANGIVAVILSLLMSVVQLGPTAVAPYGADVAAVFQAALDPPGRSRS